MVIGDIDGDCQGECSKSFLKELKQQLGTRGTQIERILCQLYYVL